MRKYNILITIIVLLCVLPSFSQEAYQSPVPSDGNRILTRTYQSPLNSASEIQYTHEVIEGIQYFDGLGRIQQTAGIGQSPNGKDIVIPYEYDSYGRMYKEWLPFPTEQGNRGSYRSGTFDEVRNYHYAKYPEDFSGMLLGKTNPFSQKDYERSPLNRVLRQAAPGKDWKLNNGNEIEFEYSANIADEVRFFEVDLTNGNDAPELIFGYGFNNTNFTLEFYLSGELYKTITYDENHTVGKNHSTEEFTDKQGRVILKRTYADITEIDINNNGNTNDPGDRPAQLEAPHDTYYVYDDFGNLTYVLPPKMEASTADLADLITNLDELGYQYTYDHRNRLVEKQIPGKDIEYIVYNKLDQPIMTQDANQRANNEWLFTKYDVFGRVAYTGIYTHLSTASRQVIQNALNTYYSTNTDILLYEKRDDANTGNHNYSNTTFPNSNLEVLTVNYYDTYVNSLNAAPTAFTPLGESASLNASSIKAKGLATGSKVKVLDQSSTKWINTLTYYDAKGRPVYTYSENQYLETIDIVETQLDFIGKPLKSKTTHIRDNKTIITIDNFTYDHVGRLLVQTQCIGDENLGDSCEASNGSTIAINLPLNNDNNINTVQVASNSITVTNSTLLPGGRLYIDSSTNGGTGGEQELIVFNAYDELGQLQEKKVGGTPSTTYDSSQGLQKVDYTYTVRGWLKSINEVASIGTDLFSFKIGYNEGNALYNGNIALTQWRSDNQDNNLKTYNYSYDPLNRITAATDDTSNYNVSNIGYDKNGNIQSLTRNGYQNSSTFIDMDVLDYEYDNGNKLTKVTDDGNDTHGFSDSTADNQDYWYDSNGNMTRDLNKGIGTSSTDGITYNHLNLPINIVVSSVPNNGTISYIYDATGVKLQKNVLNNTIPTSTDYAGNYIYENDNLKQISQPEGYIEPNGNSYQYVYRYTDIWGNTRLTYSDDNNDGNIDASSEIRREQNYYPFGLEHKGYNNVSYGVKNNLKTYQGQEFTEDLGLNTHEWKYRMSDPSIGRFWQIDPLAEDYMYNSTYAFQENKLGSGIELEGLENVEFEGITESEVYYTMTKAFQGVAADIGAFVDSFFASDSNTVKQEVAKVGNETISNTTTLEITETTTSHTNLENFINNIQPNMETGEAIMPNTPLTVTEQSSFIGPKNTTKLKIDTKRGSITEKLSVSHNLLTQDTKVSGSVDFGVSQGGNNAGAFISGSTSTNSGTKIRAGIRTTVKKDNVSSTFTFGFEHKIDE